jgi:hypothetical protein
VSDGGLSPSEVCLSADAPRRAPGQACACPGDCTTGTCQQGVCCSGAACGAKRAAGSVCDEPGDCESGFCSDGVCCNLACTGACVSCNQPDRLDHCPARDQILHVASNCHGRNVQRQREFIVRARPLDLFEPVENKLTTYIHRGVDPDLIPKRGTELQLAVNVYHHFEKFYHKA